MILVRSVEGLSMAPVLRPGRLVIARSVLYRPRVGDVVIIRHDSLDKIKRIANLDIDKIYVLGDNEGQSTDSRHFGWLDITTIQGKVIWPRNKKSPRQQISSPK